MSKHPKPIQLKLPCVEPGTRWSFAPRNDEIINLESARESGNLDKLSRVMDRCYAANHNSHDTFGLCIDLWCYTLTRYSPGAEELYMETVRRMQPEAVQLAAEGFGILVNHFLMEGHYSDILGPVYEDQASRWKRSGLGQYFTPWPIAQCMAAIVTTDIDIEEKAPSFNEPCVGSGVMALAFRSAIAERYGRDAASKCIITGLDIDMMCVKMAQIQLLLTNDCYMSDFFMAFVPEAIAMTQGAVAT